MMRKTPLLTQAARTLLPAVLLTAMVTAAQAATQPRQGQQQAAAALPAPAPTSYADVADFAVEAAVIVDARIRRTRVVEPERAPGLPPHLVRLYVEADVNTVIYGREAVAKRVAYLIDQPRQANGRPPRIGRPRVLLFARPIANASQLQLVTTSAQLLWSPGHDATARAIAAELAQGAIPPRITAVTQAFHVPGTVPGESETQIFLATDNGSPVSLSILRRPGQSPRWAVAYGEIVDESARIPPPRTIGWYRLACGLPRRLPASAISAASQEHVRQIAQDYALVLSGVGACDRTPPPEPPAPPPAR